MKKILLTILAIISINVYGEETLLNAVVNEITAFNYKNISSNRQYNDANYKLIMYGYNKADARMYNEYNNEYNIEIKPYLTTANNLIYHININMSYEEKMQQLNTAKLNLDLYQIKRINFIKTNQYKNGGYYELNREANLYYCSYLYTKVDYINNGYEVRPDNDKIFHCESHYANNPKSDLHERANVYAISSMLPFIAMDIITNNIKYFSSNEFMRLVEKDYPTSLITYDTCKQKVNELRQSIKPLINNNNPKIKMWYVMSQPNSFVRDYSDTLNLNKRNIISDSLTLSYILLSGRGVKKSAPYPDICNYSKYYIKYKNNNIYSSKIMNTDELSEQINNKLTPEQLYWLYIISTAKSAELLIGNNK